MPRRAARTAVALLLAVAPAPLLGAPQAHASTHSRLTDTALSKAWGYDTTIPAGKTGLLAVLHSDDRVSTIKYVDQPNCTRTSTTFYSYLPRAAATNLDYCIIRDLYPYGYSSWRSSCVGE